MSKKKKNWLEKFQDFWWDDLTPNQRECLWTVLTALRGSDTHHHRTKLGTTARIRYVLLGKRSGVKEQFITQCHRGYGYISIGEPHTVTRKMVDDLGEHFSNHVKRAVKKLAGVTKKSDMDDLLEIFNDKDCKNMDRG